MLKETLILINTILCPNKTGGCKISIKRIIRDNIEYRDESEIAETLNDYFAGVAQWIRESMRFNNISSIDYMRGTHHDFFLLSR